MVIFSLCAVFLYYGLNENTLKSVKAENQVAQDRPLEEGTIPAAGNPLHFYVAGSRDDTVPGRIYKNVCTLMEDLHLDWQGSDFIHMENLRPDSSVVIFCGDTISDLADPRRVEKYLASGGRIILAAGLPERNVDTFLQPVLGIVEKTVRFQPESLHFLEPFFPVQEEIMGCPEGYSTTWLRLQKEACVYIEDAANQAPVVYRFPYKKGAALVINSTILSDGTYMGFLTAAMGALMDQFLYPVLGSEAVFLDRFPMAITADDKTSMRLYGRTTEAFIRDILWPTLQGMALRSGIPYTASVMTASTRDDLFQGINDSLFATMGKSLVQFDMELAHASYHDGQENLMLHEDFLQKFRQFFPDYRMTSLVTSTELGLEETIRNLGGEITAVRGELCAENPRMRFSHCDDYSVFPCATEGTQLDSSGMLAISAIYASHGMLSHRFDLQKFLWDEEKNPVWDEEKQNLAEFEKRVLNRLPGLHAVSLRETDNLVNSYVNLRYSWKQEGRELHLYTDRFLKGQAFLLHTDQKLLEARGADFLDIGNGYYLIRQNKAASVLSLKEGT